MTYPGGKQGSGVYQQIINRIPPHEIYVEPFLGGGAILRMKKPAAKSICMDIDLNVIETFDQGTAPHLTLLQGDALQWLTLQTFASTTFIYIDPPYLMSSRSSRRKIYASELSEDAHIRLLEIVQVLPCNVMISGYPNPLYDDALSRWWQAEYFTTTRGGTHVREKLWMNYATPTRLHDYRYLGNNFRERERIKRKKNRWTARLQKMPDLEQYALTSAIAAIEETGQHRQEERTEPYVPAQKNDRRPLPALCSQCGWPATTRATPAVSGDTSRNPAMVNYDDFDCESFFGEHK